MIELIEIIKSTRESKKLMAIFKINGRTKKIHFGANGYKDYTIYYLDDPELAERKKNAYIARHLNIFKL